MVMYRDFARRYAKGLGIVGTVRNLQDGSVEVIAQGEKEQLEKFIVVLKRGSLFAKVEKVVTIWRSPKNKFQTFQILYR